MARITIELRRSIFFRGFDVCVWLNDRDGFPQFLYTEEAKQDLSAQLQRIRIRACWAFLKSLQ